MVFFYTLISLVLFPLFRQSTETRPNDHWRDESGQERQRWVQCLSHLQHILPSHTQLECSTEKLCTGSQHADWRHIQNHADHCYVCRERPTDCKVCRSTQRGHYCNGNKNPQCKVLVNSHCRQTRPNWILSHLNCFMDPDSFSLLTFCFSGSFLPLFLKSTTEEFLEGIPSKVTCTASYTCSHTIPSLTWNYGSMQISTDTSSSGMAMWKTVSTLTFVASAQDHGKSLTCNALFTEGQRQEARIPLRVKSQ